MYALDNLDFLDYEYCEADIASEHDFERYCNSEDYLIENDLWKTKEGKTIELSKMTTSHIKNCIKLLVRTEYEEGFVFNFVKELIKRNEL